MFKKRIVAIHSVTDSTFTPSHLESYIKGVKRLGYEFVGLNEILSDKCIGKKIALTIDDGYKSCITKILPIINRYNIEATVFIAPALLALSSGSPKLKESKCYSEDTMSLNDLKLWMSYGHKIGHHTNSHIDLYSEPLIKSIEDLKKGMKFFNDNNIKIDYFAYPFGFLPKEKSLFIKELKNLGIKNAFTIKWGDVNITDPFYINRVCLGDSEPVWFSILKTTGLVDFHYKKQYKRNYERVRYN